MMQTQSLAENNGAPGFSGAVWHRIRFVEKSEPGQTTLLEFADPAPARAVSVFTSAGWSDQTAADELGSGIDILAVAGQPSETPGSGDELTRWVLQPPSELATLPITIQLHGAQVMWRGGRAAILAPPERLQSLLLAVIEFCFYERELGQLERTTAESWPVLETDAPLAFAVTSNDLERQEAVAGQMTRLINMRMRHARIAPHLNRPAMHLATLANQLGERLRERARVEERLETLGSQLEVFERVYEQSSQRFSEFRTSRHETTLEWLIIVILSAETILILIEILLNLGR